MDRTYSSMLIALASLALLASGMTACASSNKQKKDKSQTQQQPEPVKRSAIFANGQFNPSKLSVPKGSTIVFKNKSNSPLAVKITALDLEKKLQADETWSKTFKTTGEFMVENRLADTPQKMTIMVK